MADSNWQRVRKIFDDALRQKNEARQNFVRQACGKNKTLLADVESLLESLDNAENFMEKPVVDEIAGQMLKDSRKFSKGQFLNHYEIIGQIGAGGMGEIYLAQDTKLFRRVALKILHDNLLSDKQAKRRLLREAQAVALLEHSHICTIYEISEAEGCSFIVMQYVEGKTLADILAESRLDTEKSLDLAIQIADALAEAHAHKLIHRDIKPANIMVSEKGQVKVLDFGLAKFIESETSGETAKRLNSSGAVMGTVPYMSPEQLCGKHLDARTDIFSFGAVFYEMLTGRQGFAKETNAETISAILNDQPDLTEIPQSLQPIVQKSLMKNKDDRYQTAGDLMRNLLEIQKSGKLLAELKSSQAKTVSAVQSGQKFPPKTGHSILKPPRFYFWKSSDQNIHNVPETELFEDRKTTKSALVRRNYSLILFVITIFSVIGATAWFGWQMSKNDESHPFDALRSVHLISWKIGLSSNYTEYRLSHNGKMIAFSSSQNGGNEGIYVKQTADGEDIRITKDEWTNHSPLWSPDDQRIAFVSVRDNQPGIYVCPAFGGATIPLKITERANFTLRHWSLDGTGIFYEQEGNLFRLDLATRDIARITDFTASRGEQRFFNLSPDEKQIVFCDKRDGQDDVWTMPLVGGEPFRLTNDKEIEIRPRWHPDGKRILYNVQRADDTQINLAYTDGRAPVQVTRGDGDYELLDISKDGTKIFYSFWEKKSDIGGVKLENGEEFEAASEIEAEFWADVSPDGKSMVFQTNDTAHITPTMNKSSIVVKSLTNRPPLLFKGFNPHWLPDSRRIAFLRWSEEEQNYQLWLVNTVSGEEKKLATDGVAPPSYGLMPITRGVIGNDWSPDANHFVYLDSKRQNIRTVSVESNEALNLTNNTNPNLRFYPPLRSPDGKRIVYLSTEKTTDKTQKPKWSVWLNEDGQQQEIFPTMANLRLLGWSASGDEILFAMTDGVMKVFPLDVKLLEVSVTGSNRVLTVFKNIYADSLRLSANGKMLVFTARNDDKDNLWIAPVSGGEPIKVTANINSRLFFGSPAWSPDGKTIFFDKQGGIVTISMFENFK